MKQREQALAREKRQQAAALQSRAEARGWRRAKLCGLQASHPSETPSFVLRHPRLKMPAEN